MAARASEKIVLEDSDILVVAHKAVSKSEGRIVDIVKVTPSEEAICIAEIVKKDPRKVEVILSERKLVLRTREPLGDGEGVIITRHRLGFVSANAAVDESNADEEGQIILLPVDPDKSARELRRAIRQLTEVNPGIVISDTFGRPWRLGQSFKSNHTSHC